MEVRQSSSQLAERERIRASPSDILLTNFMMLEMLLTRQDALDRDIVGAATNPEYLQLDELHTSRGRQGADVAMPVRRLRERIGSPDLACIGTSTRGRRWRFTVQPRIVVADVNATMSKHLSNSTQTQREAEMEPYRLVNEGWRKAAPLVRNSRHCPPERPIITALARD